METTILLDQDENVKNVEQEEKTKFLHHLLNKIGVPIDFWTDEVELSVDQRIKLRTILATYNIDVIDDRDGALEVFIDKEIIATFNKPTYKLKRDYSQLDKNKQLYIEMSYNFTLP